MIDFKLFVVLFTVAFFQVTLAVPQEIVAALLQYQQKCIEMSGSDEGYRQTLAAMQGAKVCLFSRIDTFQMQLDAVSLTDESGESRKIFFDKYCPKFNETVSCFDDIFEGIAKCTGEDQAESAAVFKDMAYGIVELICQNDGQLIFDAKKPEFKACVNELKEAAGECKLSDVTKNVSLTQYGEEQCREVEASKDCIKQAIDEKCETPEVFKIFEVLYAKIMKASHCDQHKNVVELYDNNIDEAASDD